MSTWGIPLYHNEEDTWSHNLHCTCFKFICIQDYKAFKINTSCKLSNYNIPGENDFGLVHSCCRGVVHFLAHKTTLLTLTLRHSNTLKNNMNADSTKDKEQKPKDVHITLSNKTCAILQNHKQWRHATKWWQLTILKIQTWRCCT